MPNRSRSSPPHAVAPVESPSLLRELARTRAAYLSLQSAYTYGSILLHRDLPGVARMLGFAAKTTGEDALALGLLLCEQGTSHAVNTTLRDIPYRLLTDADSHAPVVALRLINDRIRDEKSKLLHNKALQKRAVTEAVHRTLSRHIQTAEERIAHLEEAARLLSVS